MASEALEAQRLVKSCHARPDIAGRMTDSGRIAVRSRVRITWKSPREGYCGTVVEIRDGTLFVRFDGDRWRFLPPVPVRRDEVMLDGKEHPAGLPRVDDAPSRGADG